MNNAFQTLETSVEDIFKSTPNAVRFFLDWKTACVGCGFARFCTLKDVVRTYSLDEKLFLDEFGKIAIQKS